MKNAETRLGVVKAIVIALLSGCSVALNAGWEKVPLTTEQQRYSGVGGGEGFQQVMSIAYAPLNPQIVFMGTDTSRVWKSVDGGMTWTESSRGIDSNGACAVFVLPNDENRVLAAGCLGPMPLRARRDRNRREGIFLSENGGVNWRLVYATDFYKLDSKGQLFGANKQNGRWVIYAGSYSDGLLYSTDGGRSWHVKVSSLKSIRDIEPVPGTTKLLVASSEGLFSVNDDGSYNAVGKGLPEPPSNVAINVIDNRNVLAAASGRIYASMDGGQTFFLSSKGLYHRLLSYVSDVFISTADPSRVYATTRKSRIKGPYYSEDGGRTWKLAQSINAKGLTDGGGFWFSSPIAPSPNRGLIALAASNGKTRILKTEDGGETWYFSGTGFTGARVEDMAFLSLNEWFVGLTDHGLWKTTNNGETFQKIGIPGIRLQSIGGISAVGRRIVVSVGGWRKKHIAVTHDNGGHWMLFRNIEGQIDYVKTHPNNQLVIYAGMFRSDDGGRSWNRLQKNILAMDPGDGDIVYAVDSKTGRIFISLDRGAKWKIFSDCEPLYGVNQMVVSREGKHSRLLIATNNGLFFAIKGKCEKSLNASGIYPDGFGLTAFRSIAIDPSRKGYIYAGRWAPGHGASSGILMSENGGKTWHPFNVGMPNRFDVWNISVNPYSGERFIGTTFGLFRYKETP